MRNNFLVKRLRDFLAAEMADVSNLNERDPQREAIERLTEDDLFRIAIEYDVKDSEVNRFLNSLIQHTSMNAREDESKGRNVTLSFKEKDKILRLTSDFVLETMKKYV